MHTDESQPVEGGRTVAIIGAGQSGVGVAKGLRSEGFTGTILLFGDETHTPYERPPLSKGVLLGEERHLSSTLLSEADAIAKNISLRTSARVASVDLKAKSLALSNGEMVAFDELVFATGGTPRRIGIEDPSGNRVFVLRTRDDALRLRAAMLSTPSILIIGGGWIGLEVASTARKLGCAVTVVEAAPRLAMRSAPEALSEYLLALHEKNEVTVLLNTSINSVVVTTSGATATLSTGEVISADLVLEGIGMVPNDRLAHDAGIPCDGGIPALPCAKTSIEGVWAVGDVSVFERPSNMGVGRLESWANANEQSLLCARSIVRNSVEPYDVSAWFWSDQYGVNMQMCGNFPSGAEVILRSNPGAETWSALAVSEGVLVGAIVVDDPKSAKAARRLLDRQVADLDALRDLDQTLSDLLGIKTASA